MVPPQESLVHPVAKLDIKDLLEGSPTPNRTAQPSRLSQSISVPSAYHQHYPLPSPSSTSSESYGSAATVPQQQFRQQRRHDSQDLPMQMQQHPATSHTVFAQPSNLNPAAAASIKRRLSSEDIQEHSPAKKSSKWSSAEDEKIIFLRGSGMKWEDISDRLPGRSYIACRLHYQNYLERRADWTPERKAKLARVYGRYKAELWTPIANEVGLPWRACEAMHYRMGEGEMARLNNAVPFALKDSGSAAADNTSRASGRVARCDRMRESTRIFEGRDLGPLSAGEFDGAGVGAGGYEYGYDGVELPPIKLERMSSEDADEEDEEEEGEGQGGSGMRLPGFAELSREVERKGGG